MLAAAAPGAFAETLRVVVGNVQDERGSIVVQVYDSPDRWLGEQIFRVEKVTVAGNRSGDSVTVELTLPAGEYALSVYQDTDGNGKMARNFVGLPKEPAGLSNNIVPRFGPPKYKDAKFELRGAPAEQRIKLN